MGRARVGIALTVDGNVIIAPVGAVEPEEESEQRKVSRANKPPSFPHTYIASIIEPICLRFPLRPLISTIQFYTTSLGLTHHLVVYKTPTSSSIMEPPWEQLHLPLKRLQ
jgi:hypothetical protein